MYDNNFIVTNSKGSNLNITLMLENLIDQASQRYDIFNHIKIENIIVSLSTNRKNSRRSYTYGKCVPLKFKDGADFTYQRGVKFQIPEVVENGNIILYALSFFNPRFFELTSEEKLRVIFHEMYHISPDFNGDIRRFGRSGSAHGSSRKKFDSFFEKEQNDFYNFLANSDILKILEMPYNELFSSFNNIFFNRFKPPKPFPV